ncbi:hypothetical protein NQ315_010428 [Exocentrus adspersus]|uniref:Uncharacterized protein n=1 Tax=Exocentrus adspersus TaxID=1586481 RepID=A0AAV8WDR2_9CUCU|nr:hypothetical protein NQ315_010428 [Exocentrus adspersus]
MIYYLDFPVKRKSHHFKQPLLTLYSMPWRSLKNIFFRMVPNNFVVLGLVLISLAPALSQTNGVRQNLIQCYNVTQLPGVLTANGRPPATLNVLLEFIRRLEDNNPTIDTRELAVLILQRLRQDGIMGTSRTTDSRFVIPFSPKRLEAYKSTLILQRFLTNVSRELNTGDLDPREVCSLHYMISSTVDNRVRGDESTTCSGSSRYTSRIFFRRKREGEEEAAPPEVTEAPEPPPVQSDTEEGNVEVVEGIEGFGVRSITTNTNDISRCPLELGVAYTNFGTIKVGQVLAGIAAGLNAETVSGSSDNRYASTIAGELAEAGLAQATSSIVIGAQGGWNGTIHPRYYFLHRNTLLQTTDAEIRGSLDGLYMALRMDSWRSTFSDIKISQILDMYYSPYQTGVFDDSFKACNRNLLYTEIVPQQTLREQILAIMGPLDDASQYGQTVASTAYEALTAAALDSFNSYFTQMGSTDLSCRPDDSYIERVATDLLIFLDSSWSYSTIQPILSYVLDNIDVNKYGTRYTIFNAQDRTNFTTNGTNNLLDFYKQFNQTVYQSSSSGVSYTGIFEMLERFGRAKLDNSSYSAGESTIVLLIPRSTPSQSDNTFMDQRREIFRHFVPDLNILVLGTGTENDYNSVVNTPSKEVLILSETTNEETLKQIGQNIVERIRNVPRAVVNPGCGSAFSGTSRTFSVTDYVEPRGVNYYRISPHYFYTGDGTRNLKITENSYGSIDVCISRDQSRPNNQTGDCQTLRSQVRTIDISGYCGGSVSGCSPIYISVAGNATQNRCRETLCRFPNNVKYTITLENVGCASDAIRLFGNFFIVAVLFFLLRF